MILYLTGLNEAKRIVLSDNIKGNYQIAGYKDEIIATVVAQNNKWAIYPVNNYVLYKNETMCESDEFDNTSNYKLENKSLKISFELFAYNPTLTPPPNYEVKKSVVTISRSGGDITFQNPMLGSDIQLTYNSGIWTVTTQDTNLYVNDRLSKKKTLMHGDELFIKGLKVIPFGNRMVVINSSNYPLTLSNSTFTQINTQLLDEATSNSLLDISTERSVFEGEEYFTKAPRFKTVYRPVEIGISPPPTTNEQNIKPGILTIGPQMTMMLTSVVGMFSSLTTTIASGNISAAIPTLVLTGVTMASSLLWPTLTRKWTARNNAKKRLERIKKYRQYLDLKEKKIIEEREKEKQVLVENNVSLEECQQIIYNRRRNLWERDVTQPDFLTVRLGIGTVPAKSTIAYKESEFSTDDNFLITELDDLVKKYRYLDNVPQCISLVNKRCTAVIGVPLLTQKFLNSVLLQLMTFHSFLDLKIVIFTNQKNAINWEYCDILPHCWNNSRTFRYVATNYDEMQTISTDIMKEYNERKSAGGNEKSTSEQIKEADKDNNSYMNFPPYYLFIVDDLNTARQTEIFKNVLGNPKNLGFSMIIKNDRISNLPSSCSTFINIEENLSGLFENELDTNKQMQFKADINNSVNMYGCAQKLSNIPCALPKAKYDLPKSISFLDMYGVGNIEQLNTSARWKQNNPIASLSVPVGIDQNGNLFNMDIHEKAYGPHGLVAGTTGSGKSEWIITYILSLAINFNPNEVQFVLIDYKGGGLAGSFENSTVGIRLPHLVGTITNLDKSEVRRSIASIESELKRRQRLFNEAREKLKDSSMNIYKYQDYFRQGLLDEPMSHLFIISDEFAELKSQEPEFLDQLVSTARIGRSLGVHLILATQKPSGVVNDQIWSNSRFKVCLRVADPGDSNEMLKKPDAAYLKTTGAFYLQVGNDELYALGQSAYAGFKYYPSNTVKKKIDEDLHIIDKVGNERYTITDASLQANKEPVADQGEELLNLLKYVDRLAKEENFNPRKLWLDAIPDVIFSDVIKKKYNYTKKPYFMNPVIGEYDDPYTQSQKIYTIPLTEVGNVSIHGDTGSGKELLLQSMLYSLSSTYTLGECNCYVLDFGAQILKIYENNPMVGSVINGEDKDKVDGLFIFLNNLLKERKLLFADYGGDYQQFIATSGKSLPNVIIFINNLSQLMETFPDYGDMVRDMATISTKYGIFFIVTNNTNLNIRMQVPFTYKICLNYANENDYKNIFQKNNVFPKNAKSRGIMQLDGTIYEFQTAIPTTEDKLNDTINKYNEALNAAYKMSVPSIAYLPQYVTPSLLIDKVTDMSKVPIGIKTSNVKTLFVNFRNYPGTLIFGSNMEYVEEFEKNLIKLTSKIEDDAIFVFDPKKQFEDIISGKVTYVKDNFDEVIGNLHVYVSDLNEKVIREEKPDMSYHTFIIINSAEKLLSSMSHDSEQLLGQIAKMMENVKNIHFIIVEQTNTFRSMLGTQWIGPFRPYSICIGPGIQEQIITDVRKMDIKPTREGIPDDYAYFIENGKGQQFKIIEDEKNEEDE